MDELMKLLVFDLGHVLIDFEWMEVCYAFSERCGLPNHEILRVFSEIAELGYEKGRVSTFEFLSDLNRRLGSDIDQDEFKALWNTSFRSNPEMFSFLDLLSKSHKLFLLSNTNECHYTYIQENFDVERHFLETVLSYRVGHAKPEAAIYRAVVDKSGVMPEDCLFVDDLECNVKAAKEFGMEALLFTDPGKLKSDLTAFGIKTA